MRAHYFQHDPAEGLGSIEPWLQANGYQLTCTRFFAAEELPNPQDIDLLVIMGGPMSVNDEANHPWLVREKQFVRTAIKSGKSVLGICLGAQMIACELGARVFPNREKEIGWHSVHGLTPADDSTFSLPPSQTMFHWHGETFELPRGATRLARSEACENQAFQLGRRVIGLQFHPEMTPGLAAAIVAACSDELVPAKYVQTAEEILSASQEQYQAMHEVMDSALAYLHQHNT